MKEEEPGKSLGDVIETLSHVIGSLNRMAEEINKLTAGIQLYQEWLISRMVEEVWDEH